ncbi:MAG TPA: spondin domain-containing protein [Gemmatimonadales bacterium]|nr:spondin domain-containing protein [Gemmatimonadales bacterium]
MRRKTGRTIIAGLIAACACGLFAVSASAAPPITGWHVKISNLTTGQPFSPPLWAIHDKKDHLWQVGHQATNGAALIAEDAAAAPLAALLQKDPHVLGSAIALPPITDPVTPPPIPPGGTREFDIGTRGKFDRVSMIWMLVRTNDGFSGLDSLHIGAYNGKKGKKSNKKKLKDRNITVGAYDAGTEKNNENGDYIPGPPFNHFFVRDMDAQFIAPHPGLSANGQLAQYAWTDPVARIEVTRIK